MEEEATEVVGSCEERYRVLAKRQSVADKKLPSPSLLLADAETGP